MQFNAEVIVHGIKESKGTFEGRDFSSTTFHCEVDLKDNGAGRSLGRVTRPFKFGDAAEFDKWLKVPLPVKAEAVFEMEAARDDKSTLKLVAIKPATQAPAKAA